MIREKKEYFFLILIFSIFSILIKLSTIPVVLLPLFLYFKHFNYLKFDIFKFKFFLIYIFLISFLIQQFIYTGCLFFPSNLTCFNVSWFSKDILNLSYQLELINKSYFSVAKDFLSPDEYLKDFNWLQNYFLNGKYKILFSTPQTKNSNIPMEFRGLQIYNSKFLAEEALRKRKKLTKILEEKRAKSMQGNKRALGNSGGDKSNLENIKI